MTYFYVNKLEFIDIEYLNGVVVKDKVSYHKKMDTKNKLLIPKSYPYKPHVIKTILSILFAAVGVVVFLYKAHEYWRISYYGYATFFTLFATLCMFAVVVVLLHLVKCLTNKKYVVLNKDDILCPHVTIFLTKNILVPYSEITSIELSMPFKNKHLLTIETQRDVVRLSEFMLTRKDLFEIYDFLENVCNQN